MRNLFPQKKGETWLDDELSFNVQIISDSLEAYYKR